MLEHTVEQYAVDYAEGLGYIQMKVSPDGQRGWPDRVFINKLGIHIYVEFKREGKTADLLQVFRANQLQDRHVNAYLDIDTKEEIKRILDDWNFV